MRFKTPLFLLFFLPILSISPAFADYYQDALKYQQKGDPEAAIIQLKNLLQQTPEHAEGRLLLGQLYFSKGDIAQAEKELNQAIRLGKTDIEFVKMLARSQLQLNQTDKASKTLTNYWPEQTQPAERLLFKGQIALSQQKYTEAEQFFYQVIQIEDSSEAKMGLAIISKANGDLKGALVNLESIKGNDALQPNLLLQKAEILLDLKDTEQAISILEKLEPLSNNNPVVSLLFAKAMLLQQDYNAAANYLEEIPKDYHRTPQYQLLASMVAIGQQKFLVSFEWAEKLIQQQPDNLRAMLIAGSAQFMLKDYQKARKYLESFVNAAPNEINGRRLLAGSQLNLNLPQEALKTLQPILDLEAPDAKSLAIAGNANLSLGNWDLGQAQLKEAIELDPSLESMRKSLAFGEMLSGKSVDTENTLGDQNDIQSLSIRLVALMQKKEYLAAHKLLDDTIKNDIQNPMLYSLKGATYLQEGNIQSARSTYKKALNIDPNFHAATLSLIKISLSLDELDDAEKIIKKLLQKEPELLPALLAKASLAAKRQDKDLLLSTLKKAQQYNPDAIQPVAGLANYYLSEQQLDKAKYITNGFYLEHPDNLEAKFHYARTLQATGKIKDASVMASQLVKKRPNNPNYLQMLIRLFIVQQQFSAAGSYSQHLLNRTPNNPEALFLHSQVLVGQNKSEEAIIYLHKLLELAPNMLTYELAGTAELQRQNHEAALSYFHKAIETNTTPALVSKISTAYQRLGKPVEAIQQIKRFLNTQPLHMGLGLQLAGLYQINDQTDAAIELYEKLRKAQPENPIPWNNLAWFYQEKGDTRSLDYAREAYRLAPKHPGIEDTLGWILYQYGEYKTALQHLSAAHKASPNYPEVQLHYAAALLKNDRKTEAEAILKPLAKIPGPLQQQAKDILNGK